MNDQQLLRYSRHILLPQIEYQGQAVLLKSHALIIGAGGLGSPVSLYMAASGVGELTICDFDTVDLTNLQRQIIHTNASIGVNKALSARASIHAINTDIIVNSITQKLTDLEFAELIKASDIVIDCSDNFKTRYSLNRLCVKYKKPLVSGAAIGFEGQITVFDMRQHSSPCYHCLFPDINENGETSGDLRDELRCSDNGVFAPLVGMIGTMQAAEAIKLLLNIGVSLQGRLLLLDALDMQWRSITLKKDATCKVCAN